MESHIPFLQLLVEKNLEKSVDGAVTLDSEVTIPYKLFQYFFSTHQMKKFLDYIKIIYRY
ncbi:MAG: hypothetical protein Ct9H90mP2_12530 [Dehalococcoidia bacterium]|nr:MAG: hypothetical protein Ct9H90mP2_12530 [Dehalococcoidia bacterium]